MDNKIHFRQLLSEIAQIAAVNGNTISAEDVASYLEDAQLSDEQLEMVYSYLEAEKITIIGHEPGKNNEFVQKNDDDKFHADDDNEKEKNKESISILDDEEKAYVDMYIEELKGIKRSDDEEIIKLCKEVISGDDIARTMLIEGYLLRVVETAKEYANKGVLVSDLIQEGNVGLMLAVDELQEAKNDYVGFLERNVREAMQTAIEEMEILSDSKSRMVQKVNFLHEGSKNLNEDLQRKATIKELAEYMEMSEEEVADIIRISDDEIEVFENDGKKDKIE